jgi:predicted alpha/beta-fold hydrolase
MEISETIRQESRQIINHTNPTAFRPHRLIRGAHVQTVASSYPPRGLARVLAGEQGVIVDAGRDTTGHDARVRLLGYYNERVTSEPSKGLVISLHGWEGHSHSAYSLIVGKRLLAEGYDLFRLNLRDHGPRLHIDPYALNRGLFMGTLLDESLAAVQQVATWAGERPVYLVGPSMGGNFVLRMAVCHATAPIANLRRVMAISPAINPGRTHDRIDAQRWLRSVLTKAELFPELYDFQPLVKIAKLRAMTEWLVANYSEFPNADAYFAGYTLLGDALAGITVPTTILTAADDPVIAVEDILTLTPSPLLDVKIERFGGHVGFVDVWPLRYMLPDMLLTELQRG